MSDKMKSPPNALHLKQNILYKSTSSWYQSLIHQTISCYSLKKESNYKINKISMGDNEF